MRVNDVISFRPMTTIVPISEAKLTLEKLVAGALAGDEVIIEDPQAGKLRLQPLTPDIPPAQRSLGLGRGNILWISEGFDDYFSCHDLKSVVLSLARIHGCHGEA